ncbi:hypothetical protein [Roseomonas mucosa]|uniref:hypothetical protein n=1 Tax=Roseomonas mucosa TaxID=207340 RepID=UPI0037C5E40C
MAYKPNPADTPRPPPLPKISAPTLESEPAAQRLDPAQTESARLHRIADHLIDVGLSRGDPSASPGSRAIAKPAFEVLRSTVDRDTPQADGIRGRGA